MKPTHPDLFETEAARTLLDQLIADSKLYHSSVAYRELLDFAVRLRNFAPFNAMLLQVQKPGLSYAASAHDWCEKFGRTVNKGARPLLILWPFGPIALVYDVLDTNGPPLPAGVNPFRASGTIDANRFAAFDQLLQRRNIRVHAVDAGDRSAGSIRVECRSNTEEKKSAYGIQLNRNHPLPVRFATLLHELGHLCLGHLGPDRHLNIPARPPLTVDQCELEAESVAYMTCRRNGVSPNSPDYLSDYVKTHTTVEDLDLYQVMRAAGQVETFLGLNLPARYIAKAKR